jgi:HD-like signal output (HDOD) protein
MADIPLGIHIKKQVPLNVMVATSSISERKLLVQYFKSAKFHIINESSTPEDVISNITALKEMVDILCIDFPFSRDSGMELIKSIREISQRVLVMVVSNTLKKEEIEELLKFKINTLLLKPISKSTIYDKLIHLLGRKDLFDKMVVGYKPVGIVLSEIQIPPISDVMSKVLSFDASKSGGSTALEGLLTPDKALCADILRIANSAYYGRSGKVSQLKDAITLMGLKTIKNIVIIQSRKKITKNLAHPLFVKHLNEIPILTGLISYDLLAPLNQKKLSDEVLLAAIFRKIGMTVLALNVTQRYQEILESFEVGAQTIFQIEQEELNTDSIQIGLKIFKLWNMPFTYQSIIANHGFTLGSIDTASDMDKILRLAELISLKLYKIPLSNDEEELTVKLVQSFNGDPKLLEIFDEEYYANIKTHPFFDPF